MTTATLELASVAYAHRPPDDAVSALSIVVRPGEVVGVVGPNGAGKTTCLRLAAGALAPRVGRVTLGGSVIHEMRASTRARAIAWVGQRSSVAPELDVWGNVLFGRTPFLGWGGIESPADREIAEEAIRLCALDAFRHRKAGALSAGELRRVDIARALAQTTAVIVLDEPIASLDPRRAIDMLELLRTRAKEKNVAVLFSIHELGLAKRHADRIVVMAEGRVLADDTPDRALAPAIVHRAFGVTAEDIGLIGGGSSTLTRTDM